MAPPVSVPRFPKGNTEKENTVNPVIKKFQFGQSTVTLETGRIARQASGAVLVSTDDVSVLVTVVGAKQADPGKGFFPLSVHYQEKTYAAGRIPGGFFKREGRPSEKETLTSRLIDRPIRPLFPEGFMNEVQVVCTVVSTNKKSDPDIAAMIGTSAALAISGIPFEGPIGAARVGYHDELGYILNPNYEQLQSSRLDMVVAGTQDAVLMVESEAEELTEDQMLGAVLFAHEEFQSVREPCGPGTTRCEVGRWIAGVAVGTKGHRNRNRAKKWHTQSLGHALGPAAPEEVVLARGRDILGYERAHVLDDAQHFDIELLEHRTERGKPAEVIVDKMVEQQCKG